MADSNGTGSAPAELETLKLRETMAECLLLDVSRVAASSTALCSQALDRFDERDKVAHLLVAIQALSERIGTACDSHQLGVRPPQEWIFPPGYNDAAKQLEAIDHG